MKLSFELCLQAKDIMDYILRIEDKDNQANQVNFQNIFTIAQYD